MRVYKFLNGYFGLKSLRERRLKISTLADLNDPFELLPYRMTDRNLRRLLRQTRDQLATNRGLLCFSADWRDPVIWAHYSDKHRGLCLALEIPDNKCRKVEYCPRRLTFPRRPTLADAQTLIFTKYINWKYEQEIRVWATLENQDEGLYYAPFGEDLRLVRVVAGASCTLSEAEIIESVGLEGRDVRIIKARAGFTEFEIVKDKRGFQRNKQ